MADRHSEALEAAISALRRKERTTAEMVQWLGRRGYGSDQVQAAVDALNEIGELDDARFARAYAEDKRELRGWGAERIGEELTARGVAPELIEAALEGDTDAAEVERAERLLALRDRPIAEEGDRVRALGFLARRGYGLEVAYEAIRRASRRAA